MNRQISWAVLACVSLLAGSAAAQNNKLRYLDDSGATKTVKLPDEVWRCDQGAVVDRVAASGQPVSLFRADPSPKPSSCGQGELFSIEMLAPILRRERITDYAFHWSPKEPEVLEVAFVVAATVANSDAAKRTVLKLGDVETVAKWQRIDRTTGLLVYRFEGIPQSLARNGGSLILTSAQLLDAARNDGVVLDAQTGKPRAHEVLDYKPQWLWHGDGVRGELAWPQERAAGDLRFLSAPLQPHDLARFIVPGAIESCGPREPKAQCKIEHFGDDVALMYAGEHPGAQVTATVTLRVEAVRVEAGAFKRVSALPVTIDVKTCAYSMVQLTDATAGLVHAPVYFLLRATSQTDCKTSSWRTWIQKGDTQEWDYVGLLQIDGEIGSVRFDQIPKAASNAKKDYRLKLTYAGGQDVRFASSPTITVQPSIDFTERMRVETYLGTKDQTRDITDLKKLAVGRDNQIIFDGLKNPEQWKEFSAADSASLYPIDKETRYVKPPRPTSTSLRLRVERNATPWDLRTSAVDALTKEQREKFQQLKPEYFGEVSFDTGFTASSYREAIDLESLSAIQCGGRLVDGSAFGRPRAVSFEGLEDCHLVIDMGDLDRETFFEQHGAQTLEVRGALVPNDQSALQTKVLRRLVVDAKDPVGAEKMLSRRSVKSHRHLYIPLPQVMSVEGELTAYRVIQIDVAHDQAQYLSKSGTSYAGSVLKVRLRRGPDFNFPFCEGEKAETPVDPVDPVCTANDGGIAVRMFGTFTVAPLTLFRLPHSGRGATRSSAVEKLEAATFGLGLLGVIEVWDFNSAQPAVPFLSPQLQFGILSTVPSQTSLDIPAVSLVAGLGLRTGLAVGPDAESPESSLKLLAWWELMLATGRRHTASSHLLIGFAVDAISIGN